MNPGLLLILPCLALSFFFSGMEAGVFSLNRWRIRQQMRRGNKRARLLYSYLENPENFLWTILVGNTLASLGAFILFGQELRAAFPGNPWLFIPCFLILLFLFYTFCDLLPKTLFRVYPTRLTLLLATPFRLLHMVLRPLVALIEGSSNLFLRFTGGKHLTGHLFGTRDEFRQIMRESAQGLTTEERAMIERVLDLQSLRVRDVMLAFTQVPELDASMTVGQALQARAASPVKDLSLIPVWLKEHRSRRVAGMFNSRAALFSDTQTAQQPLRDHLQGAIYLEEDLALEEALRRMQRNGQPAAIVLAHDRKEAGLLRLGDILNAIFGEVKI